MVVRVLVLHVRGRLYRCVEHSSTHTRGRKRVEEQESVGTTQNALILVLRDTLLALHYRTPDGHVHDEQVDVDDRWMLRPDDLESGGQLCDAWKQVRAGWVGGSGAGGEEEEVEVGGELDVQVLHELDDVEVEVVEVQEDEVLMPGFIDCHVHPSIAEEDYQVDHLKRSSAYKALRSLKAVQGLLHEGWTTLRVAGEADHLYSGMDVRKVIAEGMHQGPRMVGAGHYMSITGGGGDINFLAPELARTDRCMCADGLVVDGPEEIRKAIRVEKKYGADWIKIMVSGAFMSAGDSPQEMHFSPEELAMVMTETQRLGLPVMAHAHSPESIKQAVAAGVRSIEHGSFIDADGVQGMLERAGTDNPCWLVPTLTIDEYARESCDRDGALSKMLKIMEETEQQHFAAISGAIEAGVPIALGTDFIGWAPRKSAREFQLMHDYGLPKEQCILAGTRYAAELLGLDDQIGALAAGMKADLVAVRGDPLQDLRAMQDVVIVVKGGEVVRRE